MKPSVAPQHLFVYGTLADPAQLDHVLGHKHLGERVSARLVGYQRLTSASFPYPFVVEKAGEWVDGVLLMELSTDDMRVLDRYEEVESGVYRRKSVQVDAWGCGSNPLRVSADVYVAGAALLASTSR